jgi:hypothetical protein
MKTTYIYERTSLLLVFILRHIVFSTRYELKKRNNQTQKFVGCAVVHVARFWPPTAVARV